MSSKETAERHFKTFYQARCVVKLATFWWSLSWFGILWPSRCFRFSNVTLQTFFWIWTCFSLHLSNKHLVTNKLVIFTSFNSHPSFFSKPTLQPFLKNKEPPPTGLSHHPLGLVRGFFGYCFICCGPMAHLRLFASSELTEICGWWSSVRRRCWGGSRGQRCFLMFFLWLTKISKIPGLEWRTWDFLTMHFCKMGNSMYVEFLGTAETSNDFLIFDPGSLGKMVSRFDKHHFSKWGGSTTN